MLRAHVHALGTAALLQACAYSETANACTLYSSDSPARMLGPLPKCLQLILYNASCSSRRLIPAPAHSVGYRSLHIIVQPTMTSFLVASECPLHACTCLR